jgi:hypothetical protein
MLLERERKRRMRESLAEREGNITKSVTNAVAVMQRQEQ